MESLANLFKILLNKQNFMFLEKIIIFYGFKVCYNGVCLFGVGKCFQGWQVKDNFVKIIKFKVVIMLKN